MTPPVTVVCVLRTGGPVYNDLSWVWALKRGVDRFLPGAQFRCITDAPGVGIWRAPMRHPEWLGYWSLVNWFAPGLFPGRVIAVGLDTLMVGDLSEIAAYSGPPAGINDFFQPPRLASGVMSWYGDELAHLFTTFEANADNIRARFPRMDPWLRTQIPDAERLQNHFPGQIVSLKAHAREGIPDGARIVCLHGKPRLNSPDAGWAYEYWKGQIGFTGQGVPELEGQTETPGGHCTGVTQ